jgi:sulfoacetaldehyde acetyltransferase
MILSGGVVETLAAERVSFVHGIVGSAYMAALDLFSTARTRSVSIAHDQNASAVADGYARITNRPPFAIAQNARGITNFVTAATYWTHTPMIFVTLSADSIGVGLGGLQVAEELSNFFQITKWQVQVNRPERMAALLRWAFCLAKAEHGLIQVNIPGDYCNGEGEYEICPSTGPLGFQGSKPGSTEF